MNLIKGNKGSALVTVLLLFVALIGYTLYHIGSVRLQGDIKRKALNESNVQAATAQIRSILSTPANCNATFPASGGFGVSGNILQIKECSPGGNCYSGPNNPGTGSVIPSIKVVAGEEWRPSETGLPENIRLIDIRYDRTLPYQTMDKPGKIGITFTFEKKLRPGSISVTKTFLEQYVVFDVPTKSTIVGCPKVPQSIDAFGDKACHTPWDYNEVIKHNFSDYAYRVQRAPNCSSSVNRQTRACTDNILSGEFTFKSCITDGDWSGWSVSGPCVCVSGAGQQPISRSCTNPPPGPGGVGCSGIDNDNQACTPASPCP